MSEAPKMITLASATGTLAVSFMAFRFTQMHMLGSNFAGTVPFVLGFPALFCITFGLAELFNKNATAGAAVVFIGSCVFFAIILGTYI